MKKKIIPYSTQNINNDDIRKVVKTLQADLITTGPLLIEFEQLVSKYVNGKYSVAVNSATSGLHIACLSLGLKSGDILWTVPNTFVASANCGLLCGAKVDFVDIDPLTYNISVDKLIQKLEVAKKHKCLPKILIPVHFSGQPTEQEKIWKLSKKYGFKVVEDASHSLGASRNSEMVGSSKWSHASVFSFHPVKMITTIEGGMVLTNNKNLYEKMKLYRSHGITRDKLISKNKHKSFYYEQHVLGLNYRMNEIQAALGISQMNRIEFFLNKRNELANNYNNIWQAFVVLLPVKSVGVMGDKRTYNYCCSLRAVTSVDGMTADFYMFTKNQIQEITNRIINNVLGVNRVLFDFTSKPPGTIEWE